MISDIKVNLAAAYQILATLGLDDHTYTHLSARPEGTDFYYIYPFGLRFEEVTSNNLLQVGLDGTILEGSEYSYNRYLSKLAYAEEFVGGSERRTAAYLSVREDSSTEPTPKLPAEVEFQKISNKTGYIMHSGIYKKRPDISSIFHIHTPATVAVSSMRAGLLPISQWALHFYERLSYHEYDSLLLDTNQSDKILDDLVQNYVMFLRNHGVVICGKTIHEAMFYTYHLEQACKTQCLALSTNQELVLPSHEICQKSVQDILSFEEDLGKRDWIAWLNLLKRVKSSRSTVKHF